MRALIYICVLFAFAPVQKSGAQIKLPRLIRDSMVLQRDTKINIWGWASANEKVTVTFNNKFYKTKTGSSGKWQVQLPPTRAGGPYSMTIAGTNSITISEILFGDVWFCSGQSNMVHQMNIHDVLYAKEIAEANYPQIRQFWIPTLTSLQGPQADLPSGNWKAAVGNDVRPFSAVAYFFAKKLFDKYNVPIGIINASVGGSPIEAWMSEEGLKDFTAITEAIQKNRDTAYINKLMARPPARGPRPQTDLGLTGKIKWYDPAYEPPVGAWRSIAIPGYWEDQGLKELNGVVWYRKEVDVPASMTGKPAKVFLGRIVDADELYINGKQVGNTTYQYPQRRYIVADDVLKPGRNIFVIRVTNTNGKGGFVTGKPYCIFSGNDTIDLKGYWQYKVGDVFKPVTGAAGGGISFQNQPTALYNAMAAPVINYSIKGFCWYQGESNTGRSQEYTKLQPAMVADWRTKWNQENLPFLYVQLPNFMDANYLPSESQWAEFRDAQLSCLSVPGSAMAVAIDLGEWNDLHPDRKKEVGERLALGALKLAYGEDIVYSGPIYKSSTTEGNKIILTFDHTGSGLTTNDGEELAYFSIAGADKKFTWAKAKIEGDKVIVWNDEITNPLYVRYAWADNPDRANLYNKEGLPASPFRTDK